MDNLLPPDKEAAEKKKRLTADIKKMWEIYREHVQDGHIRSTDAIEDADAPSTPVRIQRSDSPASRHCPPTFDIPMDRLRSENFDASSSDISRLATSPHQRRASREREGGEGEDRRWRLAAASGEGCVAAPPHRDLSGDLALQGTDGDLALQGTERGRTQGRQHSWPASGDASSPVSRDTCPSSSQPVVPQRRSSPMILTRIRQRSSSPQRVTTSPNEGSPVGSTQRCSSPVSLTSQPSFSSARSCQRPSSPVNPSNPKPWTL